MDPAALWMAACLLAPPAEAPAPVSLAALVAEVQDVAARLEALNASLKAKEEEFNKAARAAKTAEERAEAQKLRPDPKEFSQSYAKLAREAGTSDTALAAWTKALELSVPAKDMALLDEAAGKLLADFAKSDELAKLPAMLARVAEEGRGEKLLKEFRAKAGSEATKAAATFHLALLMVEPPRGTKPEGDLEARKKEGMELLREVVQKYPRAADARGRTYASQAEGWIFQAERLQVGMVAPEIEAPDTSGVPFKLSDYRGKVVLLDFWGHW